MFVLDTRGYDVILGMVWLSRHHAVIDCRSSVVAFNIPHQPEFFIVGESKSTGQKQQGNCAKMTIQKQTVSVEEEFSDVFTEELLGLPPVRAAEFVIETIPGTKPISKTPYQMS